ncbi:hypothetical protein C8N43_0635 [Litoreibacter ponti]|uniref:Uncharacterized protein n=1 Tax=Litoreibacter ponti TaxID=1510457 RepID=A0A2T6BIW2_9RHOB|nr:hypothetical protein [Litoreibacter ponti]PTX55986.1 hypothetical protein C8N43_0635 [Litoreibacter ponti]
MTWNDIAQNWTAFSPALLQRWPEIEEERLMTIDGRRDLLVAEIAKQSDADTAEAERQLAQWLDGEVPADVITSEHHDNASITASANELPPGETPLDDDRQFGDDDLAARPMGRS